MRLRITKRDIVAAILISLAAGVLSASPLLERLHGLSLDALTTLRWEPFGSRRDPSASPVVVAWGPPGSGPELEAYSNGYVGERSERQNATADTTSTT